MRTTLVLDDELMKKAKRQAADQQSTLSEVVNQALREAFGKPETKASNFEMIVFGAGTATVDHRPHDFAAALEAEDAEGL